MAYEVGDQFEFTVTPLRYYQDFCIETAVLPDVLLTLVDFVHGRQYAWLRGEGYGASGHYGNGAIAVAYAELQKCSRHIPYVSRSWEVVPPRHDPRKVVVEL